MQGPCKTDCRSASPQIPCHLWNKHRILLWYSQEAAICPYPEPDESNPRPDNFFPV
jgi:hypothetical protein